ncbi:hypothetical protein HMPREF1547_02780 [Blautia sp. KLE 1732]|nr:hypothetical protein HMPREF1547_02780 [Blautia sp. KLE 1732]
MDVIIAIGQFFVNHFLKGAKVQKLYRGNTNSFFDLLPLVSVILL